MTVHVHIAAAAYVCNTMLYASNTFRRDGKSLTFRQLLIIGAGCFFFSLASHLVLDAIPHENLFYKLGAFSFLPGALRRMVRLGNAGLLLLPVLFYLWYATRDHVLSAGFAFLGTLYPDIEKTLYLHHVLPESFVLFPWHSLSYSALIHGKFYRLCALSFELAAFFALLAGIHWATSRRNPESYSLQEFWWEYWRNLLCAIQEEVNRRCLCLWHER